MIHLELIPHRGSIRVLGRRRAVKMMLSAARYEALLGPYWRRFLPAVRAARRLRKALSANVTAIWGGSRTAQAEPK